jgi:sugar/nucleoside kinase (ribokinase family)
VLFANAAEVRSLYQTASLEAAIAALRAECRLAAVTLGAEGAYAVTPDAIVAVPAVPVETVADTTGAGDLFAAGFLFGLARGMALTTCAELGVLAAGEVIAHVGPRPAVSLRELARQSGYGV